MMLRTAWVLVAAITLGCGDVPVADRPAGAQVDQVNPDVPDTTGPEIPMPEFPSASSGRFDLVSAAAKPEYRFRGHWAVEASFCEEIRILQLFVYDPLMAAALVLGIPDTGSVAGAYEVAKETEGIPRPRTARFALQTYATERAYSLPAVEGSVEIDSLADVVSGRLAVAVVESVFQDTVRVAAAFQSLPVRTAMGEMCRVLGIPADSGDTR